jgi:hypothetical protein
VGLEDAQIGRKLDKPARGARCLVEIDDRSVWPVPGIYGEVKQAVDAFVRTPVAK